LQSAISRKFITPTNRVWTKNNPLTIELTISLLDGLDKRRRLWKGDTRNLKVGVGKKNHIPAWHVKPYTITAPSQLGM